MTRLDQARKLVPALGIHAAALALRAVPRSRRVVAVGSHYNAFSDNSKYFYIELLRARPDLRVVWISGSETVVRHVRARGGEAYVRWSPQGVKAALRAGTWFVSAYASDVNAYLSHGATVVNFWHGIPLKQIERDIESGPLEQVFRRPSFLDRTALHTHAYRRPDWFISTSEKVSRAIFSRAFAVPLDHCLHAAPPRIAPLVCDSDRFEALLPWCDEPTKESLRRVRRFGAYHLYMPTWRETRPRFLGELLPHAPALDALMRHRGEAFVLKPHPATPRDLLEEFARYPNLVVIDPIADAYPLLRSAKTLVTDYSSVLFDFLFTDRPILFFAFDLDEYRVTDRAFYRPYEAVVPGPIARSTPELLDLLEQPDPTAGGPRAPAASLGRTAIPGPRRRWRSLTPCFHTERKGLGENHVWHPVRPPGRSGLGRRLGLRHRAAPAELAGPRLDRGRRARRGPSFARPQPPRDCRHSPEVQPADDVGVRPVPRGLQWRDLQPRSAAAGARPQVPDHVGHRDAARGLRPNRITDPRPA